MFMILNIAHRGSSYHYTENTKTAVLEAIKQGADMVEVDIRATKDKRLVLFHDITLRKLAKKRRRISKISLNNLKKIKFIGGEKILELDKFLDLIKGKIKGNLDIKVKGYEKEIINEVKKRGLQNKMLISSRNLKILKKIKEIDPKLRIAYITGLRNPRRKNILKAKRIGAEAIHLRNLRATRKMIRYIHSKNMEVRPYPINTSGRIRYLIKNGVDGIITDRPDLLKRIINQKIN